MKSFKEYINEASEETYVVPWDSESDKSIPKWEGKYKITIRRKNKDEASITGSRKNLEKFFVDELDFDDTAFQMVGF